MNALSVGINLAPQSGGTFATVLSFYTALKLKDETVQILNFSKHMEDYLPEGSLSFPISRLPIWRAYGWSHQVFDETIVSVVRQVDLVFIHGIYVHPLLHVARMCAKHGIPYIIVPHGSLDPYSLCHHRWRKKVWLSLYRELLFARSAAVLYATEVEKNRSVAAGVERRPECISWPVAVGSPGGNAAARQRIRTRHNLAPDRKIALFCARLARVKRLPETIRAFLREAPCDWVLMCVGPATSEVDVDEIRDLCARSEGMCVCVGPIYGHDVDDYYAAADLFILFSHSENYGHSVGQALAKGVPVALSPGVGLSTYVHRYGGGFVADGESFDDMCRVLSAAFNCSAGTLRELGEIGRNWVERELSPVAFAERLDAMCISLIEEAKHASRRSAKVITI